MTPPFQPGDRVTVRYNKPLGVLIVKDCMIAAGSRLDEDHWLVMAGKDLISFRGPATSLIKVDKFGEEA